MEKNNMMYKLGACMLCFFSLERLGKLNSVRGHKMIFQRKRSGEV